jgi:hypothetical protein
VHRDDVERVLKSEHLARTAETRRDRLHGSSEVSVGAAELVVLFGPVESLRPDRHLAQSKGSAIGSTETGARLRCQGLAARGARIGTDESRSCGSR